MKWYIDHTQKKYTSVYLRDDVLLDYYEELYKRALQNIHQHKAKFVLKKLDLVHRWIHKSYSGDTECSLLLLWHQKYRHWIKIPCDDKILDMKSVYCVDSKKKMKSSSKLFQLQKPTHKWKWNGTVLLNMFSCNNGYLFSFNRICDFKADCPKREDESLCQSLVGGHTILDLKTQYFENVSNLLTNSETEQMFDCIDSNIQCIYDIKDKQRDRFQKYCKNGEHLDLCESFVCNATYKCPGYYCVPWHYVCDGHWDCPLGFDEEDCEPKLRPGFYHCSNSVVVILPSSICDDVLDCLGGDDQHGCELQSILCPSSCFCILSFLHCINISTNTFSGHQAFPSKFLKMSVITKMNIILFALRMFREVIHLNISQSSLLEFCLVTSTFTLQHLETLDVEANKVARLNRKCFSMVPNVSVVKLSKNEIMSLTCDTFLGANNITSLILFQNRLQTLKKCFFANLVKLHNIDLLKNNIKMVERDIVGHISHNIIVKSTNPAVLCAVYKSRISDPSYNSDYCFNLLRTKPLQIVSWVFGFIGVTVNLLIALRNAEKTPIFVFTCSLCTSHLLLSAVLVELASVDVYYKDLFAIFKHKWENSVLCGFILFQFFFSSWSGIFSLYNLALSRYMVVHSPLESRFKSVSFIRKVIAVQSSCSFTASVVTTVVSLVVFDEGVSSNLCLPFGIKNTLVFTKVVMTVSCTLGLVSCVWLPVLYWKLYHKIKSEREKISSTECGRHLLSVQFQSVAESLTNIICWLPGTILILFTTFGKSYPPLLPLWTLVVIIPMNTLVFPILLEKKFKDCVLPHFIK